MISLPEPFVRTNACVSRKAKPSPRNGRFLSMCLPKPTPLALPGTYMWHHGGCAIHSNDPWASLTLRTPWTIANTARETFFYLGWSFCWLPAHLSTDEATANTKVLFACFRCRISSSSSSNELRTTIHYSDRRWRFRSQIVQLGS